MPDATPHERKHLISVAGDDSADMRLAFAHLMEEHRWPEAIDSLIELLADTRNFGSHLSMGGAWSRFSVARSAAQALGAFEGLPVSAIDALLDAASAHSADPFVACAALSALAKQDDARITPVLLTALESPGLDGDAAFRPRAQAAAWALCDRATSEKLDALDPDAARVAQRDTSVIAGPLLVAFGALGGEPREKLLRELRAATQFERETLVFSDAAPDSWGRRLLERAYGNGLSEFEYLTLADDTCRQGALRFLDDAGKIIRGASADAVPRVVELQAITAIARAYEQGREISADEMQALAGAGGSGLLQRADTDDGGSIIEAEIHLAKRSKLFRQTEPPLSALAATFAK